MNFYLVVEGKRTEKFVFSHWIPLLNKSLTQVHYPMHLRNNNFYILNAGGHPYYFEIIKRAAKDVADNPQYGQLVISIDAEDDDPVEKANEVLDSVHTVNRKLQPEIVVQNACIESWFLGNRRILRRFPQTNESRDWKAHYDVWENCPEQMPEHSQKELNRAQTAFVYLKAGLRDRNPRLIYSKKRPLVVCDQSYLDRLKDRVSQTAHLTSFQSFIGIF